MSTTETTLHPPAMDRYALYLRKSRQDIEGEKLGDEETLARHRRILTEFAARKGLYIERIYSEVVSGETIAARPQMQELIKDCYDGRYRGIIVVEVTRLSRGNQGDAQMIIDCLTYGNRNNGVLVLTPTKTYDVAHNSDDLEFLEFELFMSRREYKMIKKRMDRGRRQAVVEGNYMGSYRPYGYDILKTKSSRTLVPNAEEAPVVRMIYDWTIKNSMTAGGIARKLTAMGVPTYTGEREWSKDTIKTILTNPTYKGKVRWNDRMRVMSMVDGELVSSRPRSNHTEHYMEYDGKHAALVDEETFAAASARFHHDRTKANLKLQNPLAGLLVCKHCGKVMRHQRYTNKPSLEPRYYHPQSQLCKVKSVLACDVMAATAHALRQYIADFELHVDNLPAVDEGSILTQIEALQGEIRKTERKLAKAYDDYEEGIYSANEFVQRKAVHNERIASIRAQIETLEGSIPEKEDYEERIMALSDALGALTDEGLDADVVNAYLKQLFERIEFSRESSSEFILDLYLK